MDYHEAYQPALTLTSSRLWPSPLLYMSHFSVLVIL
jgi:hypothetical protein